MEAKATPVAPNRRGVRSREAVLGAAERLMAKHGYEAATVSALVDEAGVPPSSIYHYFGSKEGVLLAVMERGAERFFESLSIADQQLGSQTEHLSAVVEAVCATLEENPDFLRILVVMATQPVDAAGDEVHRVVDRVREMALERLRSQMRIVFNANGAVADQLARFALAAFDGAFVATQASRDVRLGELLEQLPAALIAVERNVRQGASAGSLRGDPVSG